jgi:hypothetical protein
MFWVLSSQGCFGEYYTTAERCHADGLDGAHCLMGNRLFQLFGEGCVMMKNIRSIYSRSSLHQKGLCLPRHFFLSQMGSTVDEAMSREAGCLS